MSEAEDLIADMVKLYKEVLKTLRKSLKQERKSLKLQRDMGLGKGTMAKEIQMNIDEMEETLKKVV